MQHPELAPAELLDQAARVRLALAAFHTIVDSLDDISTDEPSPAAHSQAQTQCPPEPARPARRPMDTVIGALQRAFQSPVFQGTVAASFVTSALAAAKVNAAVLTANPEVFATEHSALAAGAGALGAAAAGSAADALHLREAAALAVAQLSELSGHTHRTLSESLTATLSAAQVPRLPAPPLSPSPTPDAPSERVRLAPVNAPHNPLSISRRTSSLRRPQPVAPTGFVST